MPTSGENYFCRYLIGRSSGWLEVQENVYQVSCNLFRHFLLFQFLNEAF